MKLLIALFSTFLLISCGGGGSSSSSMSTEEQKQFVLDIMSDYYLYYDQMPSIDLRDYDTPEAVLDALRVAPDRFSYISDRAAQESFFEEGTYEGIGYGRVFNDNDNTETVIYVFDDSAAGRPCSASTAPSCLQRGDIILSSSHSGDNITFDVDRNGSVFSVTLTIGTVGINSVLTTDIQIHNGVTVAYLALSSFIVPTIAELDTAFAEFKQNNVEELVLDLRYNGGGRVNVAQVLASYIAGRNGLGSDVVRLEWNDRNTQENSSYPFGTLGNQLNLNRLYALTLERTCSASELVINAMAGINVDVITVGQTTCGKPVGSISFNFDDKVLQPITFSGVNDLGNGGYFDGIEATCFAEDDTALAFADPAERLYAGALYHMENGTCEFIATRQARQKQPRSTFNPDPMATVF